MLKPVLYSVSLPRYDLIFPNWPYARAVVIKRGFQQTRCHSLATVEHM